MSEKDEDADGGIGIGGNADETPALGRGGAMSGGTQHERWEPIADVDGAIRGLESVPSTTGTVIQVSPFEPYVSLLLGSDAEIAHYNLKDRFADYPDEITDTGRALMNVFRVGDTSAFVVVRTRDRDWLLRVLRLISEEQARRGGP